MVIPKVNIEEDIKKLGPSLKISDAVHEARENHNVLVDAINLVLLKLDSIEEKLDDKASAEVTESVRSIREDVVPNIRESIRKNRELSEAKLSVACDEQNLQHEQLEAHGRRLNIIWNGRDEVKQRVDIGGGRTREYEDTESLFREFLVSSLKLTQQYVDQMILRDCHRLPKSKKSTGPPPIIAAFICQRHRNDVLAAARNLQNTNFSIKSDLPKRLNTIRTQMLKVRSDLKKKGKVARLTERGYLPQLHLKGDNDRWTLIYDVEGPKGGIVAPPVVQAAADRLGIHPLV